ncbi:PEP-CTERM sorting domain-containing protein [Akkermansiaceae bacterium]|nr:PEP-CTERM sorting domain-containing protein [Akkermansiaceae bacterium]
MKKQFLLAIGAVAALSSNGSAAVLLAGWDVWTEVSADTWNANTTNSVSGQGVGTTDAGGTWFNWNNATANYGASNDGTWGSVAAGTGIPGPSTTVALGEGTALANGYSGHIDFTITSTVGFAIELTSFNFDSAAIRSNAPELWALSVQSGVITTGPVSNGTLVILGNEPLTNATPHNFDIDLTGLADRTLDAGGSVVFRLAFSGGTAASSGNDTVLDNLAVFGVVPEPSSALLALLGGGFLLRRRR